MRTPMSRQFTDGLKSKGNNKSENGYSKLLEITRNEETINQSRRDSWLQKGRLDTKGTKSRRDRTFQQTRSFKKQTR